MISLLTTGDYVVVFVIAGISGLLGGLAAELLLNRNGETGAFELPARKGALLDLGGFSNLLVGFVVGVAILVVLAPETTVTNRADGTSTTVLAYNLARLVGTAIVAGSAGGSVLAALQSGVTAAVNETRVQLAVAAGQEQVEKVAELAKLEAGNALRTMAAPDAAGDASRGARPRAAMGQPAGEAGLAPAAGMTTEEASASVASAIDGHAARAREALAAAGRPRG